MEGAGAGGSRTRVDDSGICVGQRPRERARVAGTGHEYAPVEDQPSHTLASRKAFEHWTHPVLQHEIAVRAGAYRISPVALAGLPAEQHAVAGTEQGGFEHQPGLVGQRVVDEVDLLAGHRGGTRAQYHRPGQHPVDQVSLGRAEHGAVPVVVQQREASLAREDTSRESGDQADRAALGGRDDGPHDRQGVGPVEQLTKLDEAVRHVDVPTVDIKVPIPGSELARVAGHGRQAERVKAAGQELQRRPECREARRPVHQGDYGFCGRVQSCALSVDHLGEPGERIGEQQPFIGHERCEVPVAKHETGQDRRVPPAERATDVEFQQLERLTIVEKIGTGQPRGMLGGRAHDCLGLRGCQPHDPRHGREVAVKEPPGKREQQVKQRSRVGLELCSPLRLKERRPGEESVPERVRQLRLLRELP